MKTKYKMPKTASVKEYAEWLLSMPENFQVKRIVIEDSQGTTEHNNCKHRGLIEQRKKWQLERLVKRKTKVK